MAKDATVESDNRNEHGIGNGIAKILSEAKERPVHIVNDGNFHSEGSGYQADQIDRNLNQVSFQCSCSMFVTTKLKLFPTIFTNIYSYLAFNSIALLSNILFVLDGESLSSYFTNFV